MKRWHVLVALAVVVGGVVIAEVHRRDPVRQSAATLERLETAFRERDAAAVIGQFHADYDFAGTWPQLLEGRSAEDARAEARRILATAFFLDRDAPTSVGITANGWRGEDEVSTTLSVAFDGGIIGRTVPMIPALRVTLRRTGWLTGRYAIVRHDPVTLRLP